jgi:hypothetical protein
MRCFAKLIMVAIALAGFSGCESVSDTTAAVRGRLAERAAPRVKTFAAGPRPTYDAVKSAATQMGYKFVRGGPSQGELEAISRVGQGDAIGSSRQISIKVHLRATLDGKGTDVSVWLSEIIEPDSSNRSGQATEAPLRDTPQYEALFSRVGQILGGQGTVEPKR